MQLTSCIFSRKSPFDLGTGGVARFFQLHGFALEGCFVADASVPTLTREDAQLDLRDVEPTAMLWCVMNLQLPGNAACLFRRKRFIERSELVRVEVVHDEANQFRFRVCNVYEPLHLPRARLGSCAARSLRHAAIHAWVRRT